ncbi:CAAX prenyl protease 1 homolog [Cephus cinctus]|uniref:CAAX prenyl protease n=1 Tax=Cephus cinctus TaxID=211228 RepID=A0AAJ7FLF7_CEPCN|nr:CAAX prenyl protease 1 homolog [Cephus cinctus]
MGTFRSFVEENIRYEILALIALSFLWEFYLSLRQKKLMQKLVELPECLNGILTKDLYDKARSYALAKSTYSNYQNLYSTLFTVILILTFSFYLFWEWATAIAIKIGFSTANEILISAIYMFIINMLTVLVDFPFKVYNTFVLEEEYGFNKQTVRFFIKDQALKLLVTQLIALPLICSIIWIVQNGGEYFFVYLWLFTVAVSLFMLILYPEVIAPLFDKYSPLPEGELKTQIEALAASINFPLYKLYIVDSSKRSSHSNAYLYGFHKYKRIVLFDTLVKEYYKPDEKDGKKDQGCETDEVVGVLAHELGHWKYNHTVKGFFLTQVNLMINFILFAKLLHYQPMYTAFGFTTVQPIFVGLIIVMMYILMPLNTLMGFVYTVNSRKFEFEADMFAKKLGHAEPIRRALIKLHKDNLGYPLFDKLYSGWHHDHPPLLQRLEALNKED